MSWVAYADPGDTFAFDFQASTPWGACDLYLAAHPEADRLAISLIPSEQEAFEAMLGARDWADVLIDALRDSVSDMSHGESDWPDLGGEAHREAERRLRERVTEDLRLFLVGTGNAPPGGGLWHEARFTTEVIVVREGDGSASYHYDPVIPPDLWAPDVEGGAS